jgi:hypothetical protein
MGIMSVLACLSNPRETVRCENGSGLAELAGRLASPVLRQPVRPCRGPAVDAQHHEGVRMPVGRTPDSTDGAARADVLVVMARS